MGREPGLEVVDDEKAGVEEDQSVQKIMDHGRAVKRRRYFNKYVYLKLFISVNFPQNKLIKISPRRSLTILKQSHFLLFIEGH